MEILKDLKQQLLTYYDDLIIILPKLTVGLILVFIFGMVAKFLRLKLISFINVKAEDRLLVNFLDSMILIFNRVIMFLLFLYVIGMTGLATSILGAATISSVVIGFAFKDIAENFLAGVIMAFNRPFRIGDVVKINDVEGSIVEMSLRDTQIKTADGKDVFIPNGQIIKNPLYNYTMDGFLRKNFMIGLDYDSDIDAAREIMERVVGDIPGVLGDKKQPVTLIKEFGTSTINVEVRFWVNTDSKEYSVAEIQSQAMKKVLGSLTQAGINLPGDIIELKNYKDGSIRTGGNDNKA